MGEVLLDTNVQRDLIHRCRDTTGDNRNTDEEEMEEEPMTDILPAGVTGGTLNVVFLKTLCLDYNLRLREDKLTFSLDGGGAVKNCLLHLDTDVVLQQRVVHTLTDTHTHTQTRSDDNNLNNFNSIMINVSGQA